MTDHHKQLSLLMLFSFITAVIVLFPVLAWPHYGLFSDAGHLIIYPERFIADFPDSLSTLLPGGGRWIPLFYSYNIALYYIQPHSPFIYFFAQWVMLVFTLFAIGYIIISVTKNFWLSLLGIVLFVTSSSFFECFYTLDKSEPRMTLFVSISLASFYFFNKRVVTKRQQLFFCFIQIALGILLVFSKETGIYYAGAMTLALTFLYVFQRKEVPLIMLLSALTHLGVVIVFFVLFKALDHSSELHYVSYSLDIMLIFRNVAYYFISSPELFLTLLGSLGYVAWFVFNIRKEGGTSFLQQFQLILCLCPIVYFLGISVWRIPLDYYLLPAHLSTAIVLPLAISNLGLKK